MYICRSVSADPGKGVDSVKLAAIWDIVRRDSGNVLNSFIETNICPYRKHFNILRIYIFRHFNNNIIGIKHMPSSENGMLVSKSIKYFQTSLAYQLFIFNAKICLRYTFRCKEHKCPKKYCKGFKEGPDMSFEKFQKCRFCGDFYRGSEGVCVKAKGEKKMLHSCPKQRVCRLCLS